MRDEQELWCPDEQMVVDYVLGSLDEHSKSRLEAHTHQCNTCQQSLHEWREMLGSEIQHAYPSDDLKHRLQNSLWTNPHNRSMSKRRKRMAISTVAGAAAVIVLTMAVYSNTSSQNGERVTNELMLMNREQIAGVEQIFADPNSELYSATNGELSSYFIVNKPEKEMLVWMRGKPQETSGNYQLWMMDEDEIPYKGGFIVWSPGEGIGYLRLQQLELSRMKRLLIGFVPDGEAEVFPSYGVMTVELKP